MTKPKQKRQPKQKLPNGFVMEEVDNPFYYGAGNQQKRIKVVYNPRESPIAWMYAHRKRTGVTEGHLLAANHFRKLYETAQGFGVGSMDYTKEPVDGGGFPDILTDRQARAAKKLAEANHKLGMAGYQLVEQVCGQCAFIHQLSQKRRTQDRMSRHLKESLESLAIFWGYQRLPTRAA